MAYIRFHAEALRRLVATSLYLLLAALASLATAQETEPVEVTIPDPHFEALLRSTLNQPDGPLLNTSLATLTSLSSDGIPIASLEGIQHCTGLKTLSIRHAKIGSLYPILKLTQLKSIDLAYNRIGEIPRFYEVSPFAQFKSLQHLNLSSNQICCTLYLSDLPELKTLDLSSSEIWSTNDYPHLFILNVPSLSSLNLSDNPRLDSAWISPLPELIYLNLAGTRLARSTFQYSQSSPKLQYLNVSNSDLTFGQNPPTVPSGFLALKTLEMQKCDVESLGRLTNLPNLTTLNVSDNEIADLSPLANFPLLVHLYGKRNQVTSLDSLAALTYLQTLDLSHNAIHSLGPLTQLHSLRTVNLSNNQVVGVTALRNNADLTSLDLSHNSIRSIASLAYLRHLQILNVESNKIRELRGFESLGDINLLRLADNKICRLDALAANPGVGLGDTVTIHGNPLGAAACQTVLPLLESREVFLPFWRDVCTIASSECRPEEQEVEPQGIVVDIPDPVLEAAIRYELDSPSVQLTDVMLTYVSSITTDSNLRVSDLTGIEYCTMLDSLDIRLAEGTDTNLLKRLTRLAQLTIDFGGIGDLGFVSGLVLLEELHAPRNLIVDLSPLSKLANLEYLDLNENLVSDLSPIAFLPRLAMLSLKENNVCSAAPLAAPGSVPSLSHLDLSENPLSSTFCDMEKAQLIARDVSLSIGRGCSRVCGEQCAERSGSPVVIPDVYLAEALREQLDHTDDALHQSSLASLCELEMADSRIRSLEGLQYCTNIRRIRVVRESAKPLDISALAGLESIISLSFDNVIVENLDVLSELPNLEELKLSSCRITDTMPLASLTNLTTLDLTKNSLANLDGLATLSSLRDLNLSENNVADLNPLAGLTELRTLDISKNHVGSIDALATLVKLESLDAHNILFIFCFCESCVVTYYTRNQITNLDALKSMPNLRILSLGNRLESQYYCEEGEFVGVNNPVLPIQNQVSDLSPLSQLVNLESIDLVDNNVCDLAPLLANPGIGSGDYVTLSSNPLSAFACAVQVEELKNRGAVVSTTGATCQGECPAPEGEGEGVVVEGEGIVEGSAEGASDGEGLLEGTPEGSPEGGRDGEGTPEGEGQLEGQLEGQPEGVHDGAAEGAPEGGLDGEGVSEGEGVVEGSTEGEGTGDGAIEGEGDGDGGTEGEGQGEGMPVSTPEALLQEYHALDTNDDGVLTTSETGDGEAFQLLDRNGDRRLSVAELRQASGAQAGPVHASDSNGDGALSLEEVLRGIQFFNAQGLRCAANADSEDGYRAGRGDSACVPHSLDYAPQDWSLSLSELLRLVQLHNGGYHACETYEDGYCLGEIN